MTHQSKMSTDDSSVIECDHLTVLAVVSVRERCTVYSRATVFPYEIDHGGSKGFARHRGCRPELPICGRDQLVNRDHGMWFVSRYWPVLASVDLSRGAVRSGLCCRGFVVNSSPAVQLDSKVVEFGRIPFCFCSYTIRK